MPSLINCQQAEFTSNFFVTKNFNKKKRNILSSLIIIEALQANLDAILLNDAYGKMA